MKLLEYTFGGICLLYLSWWQRGAAQYFKDPSITFKNITFDSTLRGSYNLSQCVRDHINCWEIIKADQVCDQWWWYHQDSVCSMLRDFCKDVGGMQEFENRFTMMESWCSLFETWT